MQLEQPEEPEPDLDELPRVEECVIDLDKLEKYALSPDHDTGRHKARVFRAAVGFEQGHADELREQIALAVPGRPATFVGRSTWGIKYTVVVPIQGPGGSADVVTGWIVEGSEPPRLTSVYIDAN